MRRRAILILSLISPCRYKAQGSLTSQPVAFVSAWSTTLLGLCHRVGRSGIPGRSSVASLWAREEEAPHGSRVSGGLPGGRDVVRVDAQHVWAGNRSTTSLVRANKWVKSGSVVT